MQRNECALNCQWSVHVLNVKGKSADSAKSHQIRTHQPADSSTLYAAHFNRIRNRENFSTTSIAHPTIAIMATELTVQSERAYQKQPHIFQNHKASAKVKSGRRWYKDVGLGFRTPKTAIDGSYIGAWKPSRGPMRVLEELLSRKKQSHGIKHDGILD